MRKFLHILLLFMVLTVVLKAQHYQHYSEYMFNGLAINPAYTGSREVLSLSLLHRDQWVGIKGAPVTQTLSIHGPLKNDKIGIGLYAYNEEIGVTRQQGFYLNYAYRIRFGSSKLAFGLKAGLDLCQSNWSDIEIVDQNDKAFESNSPIYVKPNVGAGFYFYNKKYYAGLSVPLLLTNRLEYNEKIEVSHNFKNYNTMLTAGVLFKLNNSFKVKPSFLIKYHQASPMQFDLNANFIYRDIAWLGFSYRLDDAVVAILQYQITPQLAVGYAYDYTLSELNKYGNGSHEIMIRYELGFKVKAYNPRYF